LVTKSSRISGEIFYRISQEFLRTLFLVQFPKKICKIDDQVQRISQVFPEKYFVKFLRNFSQKNSQELLTEKFSGIF